MKKLLLITIILLFCFGCQETTNSLEQYGSIKGKIVVVLDNADIIIDLSNIKVYIPGTSAHAYTDSAGQYLIYGLPEGTYDLYASYGLFYDGISYDNILGSVLNVSVTAGETTIAPDIVYGPSSQAYFASDVHLIDSLGGKIYLYNEEVALLTIAPAIGLKGRVYFEYLYNSIEIDTVITVQINDQSSVVEVGKGIFSLDASLAPGMNSVKIWLGTTTDPLDYLLDASVLYVLEQNILNIELEWNSYNSGGGDAGDFDIHLINEQTGDSCWYKNPNPDWGLENAYWDDPELQDYDNYNGNEMGQEDLDFYYAEDGDYTVKVFYFSNASDESKRIRPQVRINYDGEYLYFTAPTQMSVGDLWLVAELSFPKNVLKPLNKIKKGYATNNRK